VGERPSIIIWAQGARAGDPLFFSSLYTKTCTRTRTAETADATYGRLPCSRADRRRAQACGARRSRAGIGARQQRLWVTHTHQAGRQRWRGAARGDTKWRGAARGDNRAIVASPGCARTPSHIALQCADASCCSRPRRAALETPATSNLHAPTRPMARAPVGNAKTHSTPSHYDGVEHKWWLPSPPPPPLPPPWASRRRPRHHTRRRLRRATRCVGAFAAAPAQHARALRAIDSCCGHELTRLRVRAQLLRSARASRRAAKPKGARRSMANVEMVGSSAVRRRAWSRSQRGAEARIAQRQKGSSVARTN
jgi:hypothetical protein